MRGTSKFLNQLDRKQLKANLFVYFELENCRQNEEQIPILIKAELSTVETMRKIILYSGFEPENFIYHLIGLYPHLFNKSFIRKVKKNVNEGFPT
jgi:hypothetical protein